MNAVRCAICGKEIHSCCMCPAFGEYGVCQSHCFNECAYSRSQISMVMCMFNKLFPGRVLMPAQWIDAAVEKFKGKDKEALKESFKNIKAVYLDDPAGNIKLKAELAGIRQVLFLRQFPDLVPELREKCGDVE